MYSLIDIGSNTIRLVVYENDTEVLNRADYTGLISYVKDGRLTEDGEEKLIDVLLKFKSEAKAKGAQSLYAFATASLRDISDKEALICRIEEACGIQIDIISGDKEAEFDYLAISEKYNVDTGAAFDLGGGSCQLMMYEKNHIIESRSMPIGALKLYNMFVSGILPTEKEMQEIARYVRRSLSYFGVMKASKAEPIFAMGGAACTLMTIAKAISGKDKTSFTKTELLAYAALDEATLAYIVPQRLKTIVPAIVVITQILDYIGADTINVTTVGVRDGVLKMIKNLK